MGSGRRDSLPGTMPRDRPGRLWPAVVAMAWLLPACNEVDAPPAPPPPTKQAEPEPDVAASEFDLSSPASTLASFVKARYELRNLAAVKTMIATEGDPLVGEQLGAEFAFSRAAERRFGADARDFPDRYIIPRGDYLAAARDGQVRVDGDAATVAHPRWPEPIRLRRDGGRWRLDLTPAPGDAVTAGVRDALRRGWTGIWRELADELATGKHKDLDEVEKACGLKMGRITRATIGAR